MKLYSFETIQQLPFTIQEAWDFLSSPDNLNKITPPEMDFKITSAHKIEKMYAGQLISYTVKPLLGIPVSWVTEITHVNSPFHFVDEQRFGPYSFWHHQHFLKEIPGGVEMRDIVHYGLPLGFLGRIANALIVKNQLKTIFNYRHKKLEVLFGKIKGN
jgi:ligand-binding SRPBCC domain-containing protein